MNVFLRPYSKDLRIRYHRSETLALMAFSLQESNNFRLCKY